MLIIVAEVCCHTTFLLRINLCSNWKQQSIGSNWKLHTLTIHWLNIVAFTCIYMNDSQSYAQRAFTIRPRLFLLSALGRTDQCTCVYACVPFYYNEDCASLYNSKCFIKLQPWARVLVIQRESFPCMLYTSSTIHTLPFQQLLCSHGTEVIEMKSKVQIWKETKNCFAIRKEWVKGIFSWSYKRAGKKLEAGNKLKAGKKAGTGNFLGGICFWREDGISPLCRDETTIVTSSCFPTFHAVFFGCI